MANPEQSDIAKKVGQEAIDSYNGFKRTYRRLPDVNYLSSDLTSFDPNLAELTHFRIGFLEGGPKVVIGDDEVFKPTYDGLPIIYRYLDEAKALRDPEAFTRLWSVE